MSKTALIIVDVQNDFLPEGTDRPRGSLAVPDGDQIVPIISNLLGEEWEWDLVLATQDYHPPGHISFASRHSREPFSSLEVTDARGRTYEQTLWPDHCIQGTKGAEIDKALRAKFEPWKDKMKIVRKACHCDIEAYSAFEGYITEATNPSEPSPTFPNEPDVDAVVRLLKERDVGRVVITGLATDFCVKDTTLDSIRAGFRTAVLQPGVRGVFEDGSKVALEEIERRGGVALGGQDWVDQLKRWVAVS